MSLISKPANSKEVVVLHGGPAAFLQRQIWLQDQRAPCIGVYNIPTALRLRGPLNRDALQSALNHIVERHESLRTRFQSSDNGELQQSVFPPRAVHLACHSLDEPSDLPKANTLQQTLRAHARRPLDLERDLLIRADLFKLADEDHVLLITTHHIASDGWSVAILLNELQELYSARDAHRSPTLKELPIQYADFAAWQRDQSDQMESQLAFWKDELKGELPSLDLPLDHPRGATEQFAGERERLDIPPELSGIVQRAARQFQVTPFTLLYAAYQVLLARYCNQSEIISGTVVSGRTRTELEPLIGFLVNLLAIRTPLPDELTTAEFLKSFQTTLLRAYAHQDVSFDQVVAGLTRTTTNPVVQAVFAWENIPLEKTQWGSLNVEWMDVNTGTAKFDLNLTIEQNGDNYSAVMEYRTGLFEAATIKRLLGHYLLLLEAMIQNPATPVWNLPYLSARESQLLDLWNATESHYPGDKTIGELFQEQVLATPDATALECGRESLTYRALNDRAEALASRLGEFGGGRGTFFGVCMERGVDLIATLIAIVKNGGCYVPLEPDYPAERLRFLIRDSGIQILMTHRKHLPKLQDSEVQILPVDALPVARDPNANLSETHRISPESPAYIMYTSGSTGLPKGVIIPHRGVVRLVKGANYASLGPDETFLQYAPISFDASTFEIWAPLLNGGKLCIMPPGRTSLEDLGNTVLERKVTTLWLTSALFNLMVEEQIASLKGLRQLLTGGETASCSHFRKFHSEVPACRLINCYGPTENTTFTTCMEGRAEDLQSGVIPIGKPISNTRIYILDRFLQPVPIGVAGELYTSGEGLALEYLHAPELTAEKFLHHPFKTGERIYRTGDLARFLPDGNIQFLGRIDQQVKIRGFRIELGEIEFALRSHLAVQDAAVVAREDQQGKSLCAFWVPADGFESLPSDSLRDYLTAKLPEFLVPSEFVRLETFPLNANGKVDRKALLVRPRQLDESKPCSPRNELEERLLKIWRDLLNNDQMGVHDDFFLAGGHSLLATQVISRIKQQLKVDVPLRFIFDHSTVAELALATRDLRNATSPLAHEMRN